MHTEQETVELIAKTLSSGGDATDLLHTLIREGVFLISLSALEYQLYLDEADKQETKVKTKGDKIIRDCREAGEPFMVFRAKDKLAVPTIYSYSSYADANDCSAEFINAVDDRAREFLEWAEANSDKVKLPD